MNKTKRQIIELAKNLVTGDFPTYFHKFKAEVATLKSSTLLGLNWQKLLIYYNNILRFGEFHLEVEVIDAPQNWVGYIINTRAPEKESRLFYLCPSANNDIVLDIGAYSVAGSINLLELMIAGDEGIIMRFYPHPHGIDLRIKLEYSWNFRK